VRGIGQIWGLHQCGWLLVIREGSCVAQELSGGFRHGLRLKHHRLSEFRWRMLTLCFDLAQAYFEFIGGSQIFSQTRGVFIFSSLEEFL